MAGTVEHDNNTIIIIHLPEEVAAEHLQAAKESKELVKEEQVEELMEDDKDKDKTIVCALCNRGFRHNSSLKRHLQLHDESKAQSYECTICMKKLQYNSSLKRHMKLHSEEMKEKLYTCDICHKTFGYLTSLVRHRKLHSESEKEVYSCDMCSKTFVYSSSLKRHILLHTEGKTFGCPTCNKFFGYATSLARHIRLHTARQDFSCVLCKKTLRSEKSYMKHMSVCTKKNGVLETIEIGQSNLDEDAEDNFFSDTVKSEEVNQSSDEEEQTVDTKMEDLEATEPATMSTLRLGHHSGERITGDESELTLATVAAQFENNGNKVYKKEVRSEEMQVSTKGTALSDTEMTGHNEDEVVEVKDQLVATHSKQKLSVEESDASNCQTFKPSIAPSLSSIDSSEGEAARSLINIGISDTIYGSVGNGIVISDVVSSNLQNLVNAAVVQSEQGFVTRPALATDVASDGEKVVSVIPAAKAVLCNDGSTCTSESTTGVDTSGEVVSEGTNPLPGPKSATETQEGSLSNESTSTPVETADDSGYQFQVNGALPSGAVAEIKPSSVNTQLGHRFVATINGKEIELQLAAGSEIIQYVVPGEAEQTYIISQADTSNPDGTFLVQTNAADQSASALSSALLGAVYLSGSDVSQQEEKTTQGDSENVAMTTIEASTNDQISA